MSALRQDQVATREARGRTSFAAKVHPVAWWILGISGALAVTIASNFWFSSISLVASIVLILVLGEKRTYRTALRLYLTMAALAVFIRLLFRLVFGAHPIDWAALFIAFGDGFRIAGIIMSVAVANCLADARKLLRSTPPALFEVATAIAIAFNFAPQLVESLGRVRRAAKLRGRSTGLGAFKSIIVPTLTDALENAMDVATSMEVRGFGYRRNTAPIAGKFLTQKATANTALITGLSLLAASVFLVLVSDNGQLALLGSIAASVLLVIFVRLAGKGAIRTRLSSQRFASRDWVILGCSMAVLAAAWLSTSGLVTP